jgi:hypothetical protein
MDQIRGFASLYQSEMCLLAGKTVTGTRPAPPYLDCAQTHP